MTQKLHIILLVLCSAFAFSQQDTIALDEVHLADSKLRGFSNTQTIEILSDSTIAAGRPSLHSVLQFNTAIYFKENGPGMVSSPSFRGSSAQQTAVVWNGINVNSPFNGQTDFNAVSANVFSSIAVRSGGGSSMYGTGAIGGSIHLENQLDFRRNFKTVAQLSAGSFNTQNGVVKVDLSNAKFSAALALAKNSSDNDFDFPDSDRRNENGEFSNLGVSLSLGYKFDHQNTIALYQYAFESDRNFSLIFASDPRTSYRDRHHRTLIEWTRSSKHFDTSVKLANLAEAYQYDPGNVSPDSDFGNSQTRIVKFEASTTFARTAKLTAIADYARASASGSDISSAVRNTSGAAILLHQKIGAFGYQASVRTENADYYNSAILYSAGARYALNDKVSLRADYSKNYRIPTFNDLFWGEGGNEDLRPEEAFQYEAGADFKKEHFVMSATAFLNKISDMIQWLPGSSQAWFPQNVIGVTAYGLELTSGFEKKIDKTIFAAKVVYSYTISENDKTGNQLIYVPIHKLNANASVNREPFSGFVQMHFTGEVFTRSDNNPIYNIDPYLVANLGLDYKISRIVSIGTRVFNFLNRRYEVVERRPMPGINYSINLTLNLIK